MKPEIKELDVDFIGGQEPLTTKEEKSLSDFFRQKKLKDKNALNQKEQKHIKRKKEKV